jgi:hypothetical protein
MNYEGKLGHLLNNSGAQYLNKPKVCSRCGVGARKMIFVFAG